MEGARFLDPEDAGFLSNAEFARVIPSGIGGRADLSIDRLDATINGEGSEV